MFVDSHCHLSFPGLHDRLDTVLGAMRQARVEAALCICTKLEEFEQVNALATGHDNLWCSAGVHPDTEGLEEPDLDGLCALLARPRVVAVGETGLDYYRLGDRSIADMAWQRDRFAVHIQAGLRSDKPLVIHTRSASEDTLAILRTEGQGRATGVFHCFTESMDVARAALDLGFFISFSGILTFRNAQDLREVARYVPLDRALIETDSPYLAPIPYRGKTNEPAYVPHVAAQLAALKGVEVDEIARVTTANFRALFRVPAPPPSVG
jgi:TatD DNase family protein